MSFSTSAMINNNSRPSQVFAPRALVHAEASVGDVSIKTQQGAPWTNLGKSSGVWNAVASNMKAAEALQANISLDEKAGKNITCTFTSSSTEADTGEDMTVQQYTRQLVRGNTSNTEASRTAQPIQNVQPLRAMPSQLKPIERANAPSTGASLSLMKQDMKKLMQQNLELENKIRMLEAQQGENVFLTEGDFEALDGTLNNHKEAMSTMYKDAQMSKQQLNKTSACVQAHKGNFDLQEKFNCKASMSLSKLHKQQDSLNVKLNDMSSQVSRLSRNFDNLSRGYVCTAQNHTDEIRALKSKSDQAQTNLRQMRDLKKEQMQTTKAMHALDMTAQNHKDALQHLASRQRDLSSKQREQASVGKYTTELFRGMQKHAVDISSLQSQFQKFDGKFEIV